MKARVVIETRNGRIEPEYYPSVEAAAQRVRELHESFTLKGYDLHPLGKFGYTYTREGAWLGHFYFMEEGYRLIIAGERHECS